MKLEETFQDLEIIGDSPKKSNFWEELATGIGEGLKNYSTAFAQTTKPNTVTYQPVFNQPLPTQTQQRINTQSSDSPQPKEKKKHTWIIVLVVAFVLGIGGFIYFQSKNKN